MMFEDKIFNEDVMLTLSRMPDNSVDMIFGDPDYNVGMNYNGVKFTKNWGEYVDWYVALTRECMRVLKRDGNMFMVNYPRQNAYLRVKYLDGAAVAVNEYAWIYNSNVGMSPRKFTTAHRTVLHATKSKANRFYKNNVAAPYQNPADRRILKNMANGSAGRMPYSWFYFDLVKNVSKDKTFHSCQIPRGLAEMLIKASTQPGDLVQILFGGSGSEIMLCRELGRRFVSSEIHKPYYDMIVDRLNNDGKISMVYRLPLGRKNLGLFSGQAKLESAA